MGIASLVLGIISLITGWIPFICFIALIIAVIGLILGIVDVVKKNKTNAKNKGLGIAGLTFSAISIPIIIIMSCVSIGIIVTIVEEDGIQNIIKMTIAMMIGMMTGMMTIGMTAGKKTITD